MNDMAASVTTKNRSNRWRQKHFPKIEDYYTKYEQWKEENLRKRRVRLKAEELGRQNVVKMTSGIVPAFTTLFAVFIASTQIIAQVFGNYVVKNQNHFKNAVSLLHYIINISDSLTGRLILGTLAAVSLLSIMIFLFRSWAARPTIELLVVEDVLSSKLSTQKENASYEQ